jgi:hypothetical protein
MISLVSDVKDGTLHAIKVTVGNQSTRVIRLVVLDGDRRTLAVTDLASVRAEQL